MLFGKSKPEKKKIDPAKRSFRCIDGHSWNPFRNFPVNYPCFCESGKKFKKCCSPKVRPTVPDEKLEQAKIDFRSAMIRAANTKNPNIRKKK